MHLVGPEWFVTWYWDGPKRVHASKYRKIIIISQPKSLNTKKKPITLPDLVWSVDFTSQIQKKRERMLYEAGSKWDRTGFRVQPSNKVKSGGGANYAIPVLPGRLGIIFCSLNVHDCTNETALDWWSRLPRWIPSWIQAGGFGTINLRSPEIRTQKLDLQRIEFPPLAVSNNFVRAFRNPV